MDGGREACFFIYLFSLFMLHPFLERGFRRGMEMAGSRSMRLLQYGTSRFFFLQLACMYVCMSVVFGVVGALRRRERPLILVITTYLHSKRPRWSTEPLVSVCMYLGGSGEGRKRSAPFVRWSAGWLGDRNGRRTCLLIK